MAAWWEGEHFAEAIPLAPRAMREVAASVVAMRFMVCSLSVGKNMDAVCAGADGLSLVNTMRGAVLDADLRPILASVTGGYSGRPLKPIALAAIYACRRASQLPIVGMGGVQTGRDVLEFVACGATHVALGTILFADPDAPQRVRSELSAALDAAGLDCVEDAFCVAHETVAVVDN